MGWSFGGDTLPIHLSYYLDDVPPQFFFFVCKERIWLAYHYYKKNQTMEAPQNSSFHFEV
jgi:hypothetical protein